MSIEGFDTDETYERLEEALTALAAEVREVHRLRELLWKTHRPTCSAVQEPKPCDCGAVK